MIKHSINRFVVEPPTHVLPLIDIKDAPPAARISLYQGDRLCGKIMFCVDGTDLQNAEVEGNDVIILYCNLCQFPAARAMESEEDVVLYYKSATDAGLTCGKDPFERTGPVRL